ncbi:MAG TPA: LytTR family DNA-binding domain-containing protein [Longimicrobiales bacterium]|nr:LytTR family DNA-binding domain-containing protein [Longimicrobiales bacterium]
MTECADRGDLTALVADDEALARRRIVELLRHREGIRVLAQCASGRSTLDAVRAHAPDILFLDVQMPGLTGFEVLSMLQPEERPLVIFSTAYDEYALTAFEVHAIDYLLKPFADERFHEALRRAEQAMRNRRASVLHERLRALVEQVADSPAVVDRQTSPGIYLERFAVREDDRMTVIDVATIDWIEAVRDYVRLHAGAATHLVRATTAALEQRLDPARFMRIHRSTIVQLDRIRQLLADGHGEYVAILHGGERLRVGRSYRDAVLRRLGLHW